MNDFLKALVPGSDKIGLLRSREEQCPRHGAFEAKTYGYLEGGEEYAIGTTGCPVCRVEADRASVVDGVRLGRMMEMAGRIGIPRKFADRSLDNWIATTSAMRHTLEVCKGFASGAVQAVALCGPTERGKTHLMIGCLKEAMYRGGDARYVTEAVIYRAIRETYSGRKDVPTESQVIERYSQVDALGIDEIGRTSWTEHEARILGEIITNRDNDCKRTVIATNLLPDALHGYFDEAVLRKLGAVEVLAVWERDSARRGA